ncbi:MAG: nitroreductase [Deltaproteobacteria bacterium]|nr:nitroreductase [Deltaproteobacteria bacterium]
MAEEINLFEAIRTMRAMRRLRPDPVPDESIRRIIEAGLCAPSGGDVQHWRFIVVKDADTKQQIQQRYKRALDQLLPRYQAAPPPPGKTEGQKQRMLNAVVHLTEHFHEAPVLIVCCLVNDMAKNIGLAKMSGASIYPAVQNMLLAARGLGLGSTLTTRHLLLEKEVNDVLGLPENAETFAILPIGYPMGKFGPVSRQPLKAVTFQDRWGQPYA